MSLMPMFRKTESACGASAGHGDRPPQSSRVAASICGASFGSRWMHRTKAVPVRGRQSVCGLAPLDGPLIPASISSPEHANDRNVTALLSPTSSRRAALATPDFTERWQRSSSQGGLPSPDEYESPSETISSRCLTRTSCVAVTVSPPTLAARVTAYVLPGAVTNLATQERGPVVTGTCVPSAARTDQTNLAVGERTPPGCLHRRLTGVMKTPLSYRCHRVLGSPGWRSR
jgi:hypothetical protein